MAQRSRPRGPTWTRPSASKKPRWQDPDQIDELVQMHIKVDTVEEVFEVNIVSETSLFV